MIANYIYFIQIPKVGNLIGFNQKYYDVLSQRKVNTTYINDTGAPIFIAVSTSANNSSDIKIIIDGIDVNIMNTNPIVNGYSTCLNITAIIPVNSKYLISTNGKDEISTWIELRK